MRVSAPDWCFYREGMDAAEYYESMRRLGYEAVEMVPAERRETARSAGLLVLNISAPSIEDGLNRADTRARVVDEVKRTIAIAGEESIPQVIVFSGNRRGMPDREGIGNCARAIEELLPLAEDAGVVMTFEMLNVHDHPDYQADSGRYGFELARLVDSPRLRLVYDVYHMERMGMDCLAEMIENLGLIAHVHLAESPGRGMPREKGDAGLARLVPALLAAGYQGFWGMEFEPAGGVMAEAEAAAKLFQAISNHEAGGPDEIG